MKVYAPLQKIKSKLITRKLGANSQIHVKQDEYVSPSDIIGEKKPSAGFHIVNVSSLLKIPPLKAINYITRREGERIYKGELLAEKKKILSKDSEKVFATVDGVIQQINKSNGQIMMKIIKKQEFVPSGVWGKVVKIDEPGHIEIEAPMIQLNGKTGRGFEREGTIKLLPNRHEIIQEHLLHEEMSGKIVVGGSLLTREAITKGVNIGVVGFITGGINYDDILMINETSDIGLTIIILEGFGAVPINEDLFERLKHFDNFFAFINGREKTVAIPTEKIDQDSVIPVIEKDLHLGTTVRITAEYDLGSTGQIKEILPEYQFASGLKTNAVKVTNKNKEFVVPQTNIEILINEL